MAKITELSKEEQKQVVIIKRRIRLTKLCKIGIILIAIDLYPKSDY